MKRLTRTIKYQGQKWTLQGLFPIDFVQFDCFPMSYFTFPEPVKKQIEVKREITYKSKSQEKEEHARDRILEIGVVKPIVHREGFGGWYDMRLIRADETLYGLLLSEIYALTFQLTPLERMVAPQKIIGREFAENFYFVSKLLKQEPYAMYSKACKEEPAAWNPKRWDFNQFILAAGLERERVEQEKAMAEAKRGKR